MLAYEVNADDPINSISVSCSGGIAAGSKPRQALLFESVSEYVSPVARVDLRTQESQR